jgi:hypothetical protein
MIRIYGLCESISKLRIRRSSLKIALEAKCISSRTITGVVLRSWNMD